MSQVPEESPGQSAFKTESLAELFDRGVALQESSVVEAITVLHDVQQQVARLALFSENEELSDISTKSLPFLALEHHMAMCYSNVPTGPQELADRLANLQRACDLWMAFFQRLEHLDVLDKDEISQYHDLVEIQSSSALNDRPPMLPPPMNRDIKIQRFKSKQAAQNEKLRLESLQQRRIRLGISENDDIDGHDNESLQRTIYLKSLDVCRADALDEWSSVLRELPMIIMSIQQQQQVMPYGSDEQSGAPADRRAPPAPSNTPLQVTRITQDATGQLQVRQEQIRSQVFQPHWHQPTMSLEELAEIEVAAAMEREQRQADAENQQGQEARRYDLLKKDGLEDDSDLVDASAALDRKWDDWKDANPKGSGNKRGDVGDRNF